MKRRRIKKDYLKNTATKVEITRITAAIIPHISARYVTADEPIFFEVEMMPTTTEITSRTNAIHQTIDRGRTVPRTGVDARRVITAAIIDNIPATSET